MINGIFPLQKKVFLSQLTVIWPIIFISWRRDKLLSRGSIEWQMRKRNVRSIGEESDGAMGRENPKSS
ncbi:MAG: hypothetical protein K2O34_12365 [Acetatifactor sp.]|nr:hypothetical protein [Acetatifactor sp.]